MTHSVLVIHFHLEILGPRKCMDLRVSGSCLEDDQLMSGLKGLVYHY